MYISQPLQQILLNHLRLPARERDRRASSPTGLFQDPSPHHPLPSLLFSPTPAATGPTHTRRYTTRVMPEGGHLKTNCLAGRGGGGDRPPHLSQTSKPPYTRPPDSRLRFSLPLLLASRRPTFFSLEATGITLLMLLPLVMPGASCPLACR